MRLTCICGALLPLSQIGEAGAAALRALAESAPSLLEIELADNAEISSDGLRGVAMALETNAARARMMQAAAQIYLNTNDPAVLVKAVETFGTLG